MAIHYTKNVYEFIAECIEKVGDHYKYDFDLDMRHKYGKPIY